MDAPGDTTPGKKSPSGDPEKPPLDSGHVAVNMTSDTKGQDGGDAGSTTSAHERNLAVPPGLLRRVDSATLLPCPFTSYRQLAVATGVVGCCFCLSAYAYRTARKAQRQRDQGLYSDAYATARRARCVLLINLFLGLLLIGLVVTLLAVLL